MRQRGVNEHGEQDHEQDVAPETDASRHASGDEGRCDDGELQLEQGEQQKGDAAADSRVRSGTDIAEIEEGQWVADDAADAVTETEAESVAVAPLESVAVTPQTRTSEEEIVTVLKSRPAELEVVEVET